MFSSHLPDSERIADVKPELLEDFRAAAEDVIQQFPDDYTFDTLRFRIDGSAMPCNDRFAGFRTLIAQALDNPTTTKEIIQSHGGSVTVNIRDVPNGGAQINAGWHADESTSLIMTDTLGAEILTGPVPVDDNAKEHWFLKLFGHFSCSPTPSDRLLAAAGLTICPIDTGACYELTPRVVHRPAKNNIGRTLQRTFVGIVGHSGLPDDF